VLFPGRAGAELPGDELDGRERGHSLAEAAQVLSNVRVDTKQLLGGIAKGLESLREVDLGGELLEAAWTGLGQALAFGAPIAGLHVLLEVAMLGVPPEPELEVWQVGDDAEERQVGEAVVHADGAGVRHDHAVVELLLAQAQFPRVGVAGLGEHELGERLVALVLRVQLVKAISGWPELWVAEELVDWFELCGEQE
jgi:hypothetical protein